MNETGRTSPTILVVEDETALAELYASWLRPDYAVEIATDASDALERVDESVDVVVLDRCLPDGTGDDVLSAIREQGLGCRVAMVTGIDPTPEIVDMSFDEYRCKPVSQADLLATIRRLLAWSADREAFGEFYTVTRKQTLLETYCSSAELSSSGEYAELEARYRELRDRLTAITAQFRGTRFQAELEEIRREVAE